MYVTLATWDDKRGLNSRFILLCELAPMILRVTYSAGAMRFLGNVSDWKEIVCSENNLK